MRISDWSSDVCSSDLRVEAFERVVAFDTAPLRGATPPVQRRLPGLRARLRGAWRGAAPGIAPGVPVLACPGPETCPGPCTGIPRRPPPPLPPDAPHVPPGSRPAPSPATMTRPAHQRFGVGRDLPNISIPP